MNNRLLKNLSVFLMNVLSVYGAVQVHAQTTTTGPSTLQTPYVQPLLAGYKITSILSVNDSISGYPLVGIPDGLGAYNNGNGTFTLLVNHEISNTLGRVRDHGSKGAFVSKWVINKSTLAVQSGADLMQNVKLWNGTSYVTYNSGNPSSLATFSRFCSADLPATDAFYNSISLTGTQEKIFMNGEESGIEGRAVAHIVTGTEAGTSYELPYLGRFAWENSVARSVKSNKTVVAGMDDGTGGQVYFYIGTKTNTGNDIEKAGLTNGKMFGVKVSGVTSENRSPLNVVAGTAFSLYDLGNVSGMTGAQLESASVAAGVMTFSRPEDGTWNPKDLSEFYFATTDRLDQVNDGIGTQVGRSRLWKLKFTDINNPEAGGTIEAVLDGTEGQNMLDNICFDKYGNMLLQEDVGNADHNGKIWQYNTATDVLKLVAKHDIARFGDIGTAATSPFNRDEESSGIMDAEDILGAGWFLFCVQAHINTGLPSDMVENGQLLAFYSPDTYRGYLASLGAGPSSSQTPFLKPVAAGAQFKSIISVNDSVGGYPMVGIPDGLGAFDNGNGTFTVLMNHEISNSLGRARAHGSKGAFVSKWIINKADLSVQSGADLMQNVKLWNGTGYNTYNSGNPSALAAFSRFCSADLPDAAAFYNTLTANGTPERIFMNGEESGTEGRAVAHIVTGSEAGTSYELPYLGKFAWENSVARPVQSDKTVVGGMDDGTGGQVYFYIGTKTATGNDIEKAGLTGGKLYGVKVNGITAENRTPLNIAPGTAFSLYDLGNVSAKTGVQLEASSVAGGITTFSRPEDGTWNPNDLSEFYFVTTDRLDQVNDGVGTQVGRSRLWKLKFSDINNPENGGTIEALLDGTEGQNMLDNMGFDKYGNLILQEDVGNAAHNGKVWNYNVATHVLTLVGKHDPARFGDIGIAATSPFNIDEESSGAIDAADILGKGWFLLDVQSHSNTGLPSDMVENGQLLAMYRCAPTTSTANVSACVSYTWNGNNYTTSGRYTFATTNAAGCDSTAILMLTIKNATASSDSITACDSTTWNGVTYTASGTYTFTTTNAAGCDSVATLILTINQSTTSTTPVTACNSYIWHGTRYTQSGTYIFDTTNAAGCDSLATLVLTLHFNATSTTTVSTCKPYTWNGTTYSANGSYIFNTTTVNGCDSAATLNLTITPLVVNYSKTDATCFGSYTGSITLSPATGLQPFLYRLGTAGTYGTSSVFNNLRAASYRIYYTDANGCTGTTPAIVIAQPAALTATATKTDATCFGTATGSVTVTPNNGMAPFQYKLGTAGTNQPSNTFSNLKATTYTITFTDAQGCTGKVSIAVGQPVAPTVSFTKTDETCTGAKNGSITASGANGVSPYQYKFGTAGSFASNNIFSNLRPATYRITARDANGCVSSAASVTIAGGTTPCTPFAKTTAVAKALGSTQPEVVLAPNPSKDKFTLQVFAPNSNAFQIKVSDISGKIMYATKTKPGQTIYFGEGFANGTYIIEVKQGNFVKILKAIKQMN